MRSLLNGRGPLPRALGSLPGAAFSPSRSAQVTEGLAQPPILCGTEGALVRSRGLSFLICKLDFPILQFFDFFGPSPARPDLTSFAACPPPASPAACTGLVGRSPACGSALEISKRQGLGSDSLCCMGATEDGVSQNHQSPPTPRLPVQGGLPSGRFAKGRKQQAHSNHLSSRVRGGHAQH